MDLSSFAKFVHGQVWIKLPVPSTSCAGRTVIVTGSNVGLGKEAARHFVRLGASRVILACRSEEKGQAAAKDIQGDTKDVVEIWKLDLGDYDSVKQFAKRAEGLERLDIVVENAGIAPTKFASVAGHESTITTNVISTFLLAMLLLPTLQATAEKHSITPTLTIVSSEVHFLTKFPERKTPASESLFSALSDPKKARMDDRYNVSKLLEVFAVRAIAAQNPQSPFPVTINFVNPGLCHSELTRDLTGFGAFAVSGLKSLLARTTEEGSRTLVTAGLGGKETHGQYMTNCEVAEPAPLVLSNEGAEAQARVWSELKDILEGIQPGCTKVVAGSK